MNRVIMTIECPNGHRKDIDEKADVGAYPMCDVCYLPMFPVKAVAAKKKYKEAR